MEFEVLLQSFSTAPAEVEGKGTEHPLKQVRMRVSTTDPCIQVSQAASEGVLEELKW